MIDRQEQDKHVKKILAWRESLTLMQDNLFFEVMRMYLGEIKTPYNKQKLVENLSSFLRKDENKKNLVKLLSDTDIQIISAVYYIPEATQDKLNAFFPGVFSFAALYERLLNLEERLILFFHSDETKTKQIIDVNPLLEKTLQPFMSFSTLLPNAELAEINDFISPELTPSLIASFLSFIAATPDICKADGSFKKRAQLSLEKIFPGQMQILQYLIKAFINLSLIIEQEKGFFIDHNRCKAFAQLDECAQCAYLCVASCGRLSREGFRKQAQLLLNTAASISDQGFSESVLIRSGVLILASKQNENTIAVSRFSKMLESNRNIKEPSSNSSQDEKSVNPLDRLLEPAILFGIFSVKGKTISGERVLTPGLRFKNQSNIPQAVFPDAIRINAGFSVTVMPGLPLSRLLPLIQFMEIERFDSVATFEITRKSVLRALDSNFSSKDIFNELKRNTTFEIPQNLSVSIEEWTNSYESATLYSGYILKTDGSNKMLSDKNPILAPHIKITLAEGIFLLDVKTADEAQELIKQCGIDFIGSVKTMEKNEVSISFPTLTPGRQLLSVKNKEVEIQNDDRFERGTEEDRASFFIEMRKNLTEMNLSPEQIEGLELRIKRKIVLNSEQLRPDSVRMEKNEASGMDFIGKIRIIERAMSNNSMIELGMNKKLLPGIHDVIPPRILGMPISLEKFENDAMVCLRIEPDQVDKVFSVGQADFVKRIRSTILQDISEKK